MSEKFNHIKIPNQWRPYWDSYPEGHTLLEALIHWASQVNKMVDNVNDWNDYLKEFVETFDENLQAKVVEQLNKWIEDGTLIEIIDADLLDFKLDTAVFEEFKSNIEGNFEEFKRNIEGDIEEFKSNIEGDIEILNKRNSQFVSVLEFGADPTGQNPSTQAFLNALNHCRDNNKNLIIPDGNYLIDGELPTPNNFSIIGNGHTSNIIVDLPEGGYVFKSVDFLRGWGIEGLRFTIKPGASKMVGALYVDASFRGGYIRNIWTYELKIPYYFGNRVWGILSIDNIFSYLLSENQPPQENIPAMRCEGNTIMMSNIEIIGGWCVGLELRTVGVFKLLGFNIGGSTSDIQMSEPIRIFSSRSGLITSGWIEQLVDNTEAANGRTVYANGEGPAIYLKYSRNITISDINVASGSIFVDNSRVKIDQITYYQANGGLRYLNDAIIQAGINGIKSQNIRGVDTYSNGVVILEGALNAPTGLHPNPTLKMGMELLLSVTNASLVTQTDETTDFKSGDRGLKYTITASFQGVFLNMTGFKQGELYTVVAKVKRISGLSKVRLVQSTNTLLTTSYPATMVLNTTEYHTLILPFIAQADSGRVKIEGILEQGESEGVFLVDSVDYYKGYNVFDPSLNN